MTSSTEQEGPVHAPSNGSPSVAAAVPATIESAALEPIYTNFARVTGSPEELILDFGLNPQPMGGATGSIRLNQRLVMNYFTAKRLWAALGASLQRHEATFGALETDVARRVRPQTVAAPR
jgi:hypothetical protein